MTTTPESARSAFDMKAEASLESGKSSSDAVAPPSIDNVLPAPPTFPEGGLQAWLTIFGGWVFYLSFSNSDLCLHADR